MKKITYVPILLILLALPAQPVQALLTDSLDDIDVEVESLNRFFPESDVDNDTQEIGVIESELDVRFDINPLSDVSFEWDFGFKHVFLSDNASSLDLPAVLVGRTMRIAAKAPAPFVDDSRYRVGVSVIPSYFTDSWSDSFGDFETSAFRWQSEYWVEYAGTDRLSWKVGVLFRPDFDLEFLPIVGLHYDINDQWGFRLTSDDVGFTYQLNAKTQLFTEHRYVLDEYEITAGGVDGRVLRQQQNTTGVGVQYNINSDSYAKVSFGGAYNRSFEFVDGQGPGKAELDDSIYGSFELVWNF